MTTLALARAEGMRPQSMGTLLSPLEAMEFISTAPDPTDGRQTVLSLTDTCRAFLYKGRAARQDWLTRIVADWLSLDEQKQVKAALSLLQRLND